jgi:hypothetical protein
MAQWYLITLGSHLPMFLTDHTSARMPHWWLARDTIRLPGPNWHLGEMLHGDFSNPAGPLLGLTIANTLIYFCLFPLIAMIVIEFKSRPPRPAYVSRAAMIGQFFMWPLMAVITFFFASLPALHAQLKLASGKPLVYRVAEKGWRHVSVPVHAHVPVVHPEPVGDPLGAIGGGGA